MWIPDPCVSTWRSKTFVEGPLDGISASAALALLYLLEYVCGDVEYALCGLLTGCTLAGLGVVPAQEHVAHVRVHTAVSLRQILERRT